MTRLLRPESKNQATGSGSVEEALLRLLETQEEQDRWLLENRDTVNAKIEPVSINSTVVMEFRKWLKRLSLAPKSNSHLKNLMRVLFNAAMRRELIPYQLNPMSLVRVRDGSKRKRQPRALSAEEFRQMLDHTPSRFERCASLQCAWDFGLAKYSA